MDATSIVMSWAYMRARKAPLRKRSKPAQPPQSLPTARDVAVTICPPHYAAGAYRACVSSAGSAHATHDGVRHLMLSV